MPEVRESPHAAPWALRAAEWEMLLDSAAESLDLWARLQALWMSLEPVFSHPDILRQMPAEASFFLRVDRVWRNLMGSAAESRAPLEVVQIKGLHEQLAACCQSLDAAQGGLDDFLEAKRLAFPHLDSLERDELVEVLVGAKYEPAGVE